MDLDTDDMSYLAHAGFAQSEAADAQMSGPADMEAMVNHDMRRRSLAAGGFGLNYLTMGDEDGYSSIVSPSAYSASPLGPTQAAAGRSDVPATMEEVMGLPPVQQDIMMGNMTYASQLSAPDMATSIMYATTQATMPTSSGPSPIMMAAPNPSLGGIPRHHSAVTPLPPSMGMNGLSEAKLSMGQGPGPPVQGKYWRAPPRYHYANGDRRLSHGIDAMIGEQSSPPIPEPQPQQPVTSVVNKQIGPGPVPAPSIFPEGVYSSSGFDMLDILVSRSLTDPPSSRLVVLGGCCPRRKLMGSRRIELRIAGTRRST